MRRPALLLLIVGVACGSTPRQPPLPEWSPLEETNTAELPGATGEELYPEQLNVAQGVTSGEPSHQWAHGQGYVHASIKSVRSAMRDLLVVQDRRATKRAQILEKDFEPSADFSFKAEMISEDGVGAGLPYRIAWRERATQGTSDAPKEVVIRSELIEKVSSPLLGEIYGLMSDSFVLTELDANTTQFSAIRHLQALAPVDAAQYMKDVHRNVVARTHKQALPAY